MKKIILLGLVSLMIYSSLYTNIQKDYFVLGNEEGEGFLIYPWEIRVGSDENIYVYDRSDAYIKVYSPEGEYLRRICGKGQGPGEIQRPDGANFGFTHGDKLYITEFIGGHKWITLMELSGEFIRVIHPEISELFGIIKSAPLEDNGFIIELWLGPQPEKKKDYFLYRYPQALVRIDSKGRIISEIIRTNNFKTISSHERGADQWLPFIPVFAWILTENNSVIFADGTSRSLRIYDFEGQIINKIETDLPDPEKVRNKDLDEWRTIREEAVSDKSWFEKYGKVIEKYKDSIYDKKPILSGIYSTPDGNILVSSPWRREKKTKHFLIDKNGRLLTQISLFSEMIRISKQFIFVRITDGEGNYLVICLKRKGKESQDLKKLEGLQY